MQKRSIQSLNAMCFLKISFAVNFQFYSNIPYDGEQVSAQTMVVYQETPPV